MITWGLGQPGPLFGAFSMDYRDLLKYPLKPVSFQQLDISGASAYYTLTVPATARAAFIQVQAAPARYRMDGTTPTTAIGMRLTVDNPGIFLPLDPGDLAAIRWLKESGSPLLNVTYYA
jgi:hypothetical protein